jgi:hypothetical protein
MPEGARGVWGSKQLARRELRAGVRRAPFQAGRRA